jgi:hypothetical protein
MRSIGVARGVAGGVVLASLLSLAACRGTSTESVGAGPATSAAGSVPATAASGTSLPVAEQICSLLRDQATSSVERGSARAFEVDAEVRAADEIAPPDLKPSLDVVAQITDLLATGTRASGGTLPQDRAREAGLAEIAVAN